MSPTSWATASTMRVRRSFQLALVLAVSFSVRAATPTLESIPIPGTKAFPESITSTTDGTLYVGRLGDGGIVRVKPRTGEGSGTLDRVMIQGDTFAVTQVHGGFANPTSVARMGTTAWVAEGNLAYFFDASKKNLSPSLPFRIYAIPLRKEDTK